MLLARAMDAYHARKEGGSSSYSGYCDRMLEEVYWQICKFGDRMGVAYKDAVLMVEKPCAAQVIGDRFYPALEFDEKGQRVSIMGQVHPIWLDQFRVALFHAPEFCTKPSGEIEGGDDAQEV